LRCASIDIGTNTLRLLIAETSMGADGRTVLSPILHERRITRLGGGYDEGRGISSDAMERTIAALEHFGKCIREAGGIKAVYATATSVVRRAVNRNALLEAARERAGIDITVISGKEEARLSHSGVISVLEPVPERLLVFDIGGGSTEYIAVNGESGLRAWTTEMGVVHLSESHLGADPPAKAELRAIEAEVGGVIDGLKAEMTADGADPERLGGTSGATLVGTAGTITTLASLDLGLTEYDRDRVNNHRMTRATVRGIYERMCGLTHAERAALSPLEEGRADLIIPGTAITLATMDGFGFDEIFVSDAGLLEGLIIEGGPAKDGIIIC